MNRRQAKKIYRNWMRGVEVERAWLNFCFQVGEEGQALRELMGKLSSSKGRVFGHKWSKGWWPKGRILHDLGMGRSQCTYTSDQCTRAYKLLSKEDQVNWYTESKILESSREMHRLRREDPWGLAMQMSRGSLDLVSRYLQKEGEQDVDSGDPNPVP